MATTQRLIVGNDSRLPRRGYVMENVPVEIKEEGVITRVIPLNRECHWTFEQLPDGDFKEQDRIPPRMRQWVLNLISAGATYLLITYTRETSSMELRVAFGIGDTTPIRTLQLRITMSELLNTDVKFDEVAVS